MNKKLIILILAALIIAILSRIGYIWYKDRNIQQTSSPSETVKDFYNEAEKTDLFQNAQNLYNVGNTRSALILYRQGLEQAKTQGEKSIYDVSIGIATVRMDPQSGIAHLAEVGNNETYPDISRAFALQYAYQMYLGYRDLNLLKPFFTDEEFAKLDPAKDLPDNIIRKMHEKIETLAPLPITEVRLASLDWRQNGVSSLSTIANRLNAFRSSAQQTENYPGMAVLIPPAYLSAGILIAEMNDKGVTSLGTPEPYFEAAITKADALKSASTYQLSLLEYGNFLVTHKEIEKGLQVLEKIPVDQVNPMVTATVKNRTLVEGRYAAMVKLAKSNSALKKVLSGIGYEL